MREFLERITHTAPFGHQQSNSVISAIEAAGVKPKQLHIRELYWSFFEGTHEQVSLKTMFSHLKNIHLDICDYLDFISDESAVRVTQEWSTVRQRRLGAALACAEQLEDLSLNFTRSDWCCSLDYQRVVDFSEIAGTTTWKGLKTLELDHINIIRPLEFHQVLSRHSKTLHCLTIFEFSLYGSSWPEFFAQIKKLSGLEVFALESGGLESFKSDDEFFYIQLDNPLDFPTDELSPTFRELIV